MSASDVLAPRASADAEAPVEPLPHVPAPRAGDRAEPLTTSEIKSRAATGVAVILGRGVVFRVLGLVGNIVLARLLTPRDFGLVALGLTIMSLGQFLANAGLGAALITREQAPTREELRAITGLQLLVTAAVGAVAGVAASFISHSGLVTAFMMLALPLTAYRTPVMLLLERELQFTKTVRIEISEIVVYLVWAIPAAALGFGAWALATAVVARVAAGTLVAGLISPAGFLRPSVRFSVVRDILAFGARFQATDIVQIIHDTALTACIASIGGITALGLWSFASRILQVPFMIFEAMWRVGMPAFSRLIQAGETRQLRDLLERSVATTAVGVAAVMCPLCAASPALVPLVFGHVWAGVSLVLPGAALALMAFGPMGISGYGYLVASGDATTPLRATVAASVVRLAATAAFIPFVGVAGVGIAWAIAGVVEMPIVLGRVHRASGARLVRPVARPAALATLAGTAGWTVSTAMGVDVASVVASTGVSCACLAALLWFCARRDVLTTIGLLRSASAAARLRGVGRR